MNDYLWDKTGSDSEVEELERELNLFRAGARIPPQIKTARAEDKAPFWKKFHLAAAVPSFAAILIAVVWFSQASQIEDQAVAACTVSMPQTIAAPKRALPIIDHVIPQKQASSKPRMVARKRRAVKTKYRKGEVIGKRMRIPISRPVFRPQLTQEEKFAYSQLMKALTITSSKLQIVKDKVGGPADPKGTK